MPPSQLQPQTPRDLETICLKCLQKEPAQRYASGAGSWPTTCGASWRASRSGRGRWGGGERAGKWVQRNPVVAALPGVGVRCSALVGGVAAVFVKYQEATVQEGIAATATRPKKAADDARGGSRGGGKAAEELHDASGRGANGRRDISWPTSTDCWRRRRGTRNNAAEARERLETVPRQLRRWEWHYLTPADVPGAAFSR